MDAGSRTAVFRKRQRLRRVIGNLKIQVDECAVNRDLNVNRQLTRSQKRYKITSPERLSPGTVVIRVDFKYDGGIGKGGSASLFINDKKVGEGRIEKTCPSRFGAESFDVGMDNGSPVSEAYEPPFAYGGPIKKVTINIQPTTLNAGDQQAVRDAERAAALAIE